MTSGHESGSLRNEHAPVPARRDLRKSPRSRFGSDLPHSHDDSAAKSPKDAGQAHYVAIDPPASTLARNIPRLGPGYGIPKQSITVWRGVALERVLLLDWLARLPGRHEAEPRGVRSP